MDPELGIVDASLSYASSGPLVKGTAHTAAKWTDGQYTGHYCLQQKRLFKLGDEASQKSTPIALGHAGSHRTLRLCVTGELQGGECPHRLCRHPFPRDLARVPKRWRRRS